MLAYYENRSEGISIEWKPTVHVPPHLHESIEIVYVTEGTLALGVGQELYQMDKGDFAIVFPNVIHHYQAFGTGKNKAIYLFVEPSLLSAYHAELQKYSPVYPIIKKEQLHSDIVNAMKSLVRMEEQSSMLVQAYIQMILAHVFRICPWLIKVLSAAMILFIMRWSMWQKILGKKLSWIKWHMTWE